ncbi:MAG TPA: ATP-binding protein [Thermoanaerobaculia bacterium]|jgi:signal transduction histidine kinase|nr:ATP-binding protein [Thermoanaerobaculia bacterium]
MARSSSIGRKLRWLSILSSGTAVLAVSVTLLFVQIQRARKDMVLRLGSVTELIALNSAVAVDFNDADAATALLSSLTTRPGVLTAAIVVNGRVFAIYRRADVSFPKGEDLQITNGSRFTDHDVTVFRPIVSGGRSLGTLFIRADLREIEETWRWFAAITAFVAIPALLIAIVISQLLQRAIARPILNLASLAKAVSIEKDYSVRAPTVHTAAEIEQLVGTFNHMLSEIERQHAEIQEAHGTLEQRVADRTSELKQANQAKDRFLASMSHELRTPLNGIIGFAEFLSDGKPGPINDKQKEYLGDVLNSGRHLLHLINDMLDLVKIQAGRVDLTLERFSIRDAISEVCTGVHPLAVSKAIEFTVNIDAGIELVTLDEQRFKQILYNLLSNALKFTDDRGHVGIEVTPLDGGRFRLVVSDDGIGIRPEDIGRLFTEFEQLETGTARRFGGTGLGLALTRELVELHGGEMDVESEIGQGSRFGVVLPLAITGGNKMGGQA